MPKPAADEALGDPPGPDRAASALREYQAFVESAPDPMVVVDKAGLIVLVNTLAERAFGYARSELVGQPIELLVPVRHRKAHVGHRQSFSAAPAVRPMGAGLDLHARHASGREFPVEISLSPLTIGGRELVASAVRDVTERKKAEEERSVMARELAAREEAQAANRMKDDFLATLSHELRTPLSSILGWVQLLRMGRVDPAKVPRALETIERNARVQVRLIDDMLDLSRIISGKIKLDMQPVDLGRIVEGAVDAIRVDAEAKRIQLEVASSVASALTVGDRDRLQQVVSNLLSNAVKFTPAGGRVRVEVERAGDELEVVVRDTGAGMSAEFLPHAFDRFRQANSGSTRAHGGLGVGLAIVRHFVELHGGTVSAASEGPARGSTFRVQLPILVAHDRQSREPRAPTGAPRRLDGVRVLVVDDKADDRSLFQAVLAAFGADVTLAASAAEAFDQLGDLRPDVLMSDIAMPGEDGCALLRRVRLLPPERGGQTPALAVTAHARPVDREQALDAGFQLHVSKPVDPGVLVEAVETLVHPRATPRG